MTMTEHISVTHLTDQPTTMSMSTNELVRVPARDVVIEDNVRTIADLDPAFLASIKQHGVLLPTIGYRGVDGQVVVRDGQLRVLAAREAGHDVPVFITAREVTEAHRLVEQIVTNDRRTALTDGDRLAAYRQMELAGLSVTAIVKQTGTKRDTVKDTLTIAKSTAATEALTERQMSFDDALLFAEFDGDEQAIAELQAAVENGDDLLYAAAEIRQERERAAAVTAVQAGLVAAGKRVVSEDDDYSFLGNLTDAADEVTAYSARTPLDDDSHATCDGAAWVVRQWGDPVPVQVCATPTVHRPRHLPYRAPDAAPAVEQTEEDGAAEAEARKAARRELVANNKAWDAADTLRTEFVRTLLQRKTLPKDWTMFAAVAGTRHGWTMRADNSGGVRDLLAIESGTGYGADTVATWVERHPAKAPHVALAVVLSAFENAADRNWWRYPSAEGAAYLNQLAAWGHRLTDVEKIAAGIKPETDQEATATE